MLRQDSLGNWTWKPGSMPQEKFVSLPDDIFEGFYGGAAGGGKSEVLLMLPIARQFHLIPSFHGIIFRRTFPQLEQSLIMRSKDYEKFGAKYNDQKHYYRFPSGAVIRFSYLETNKDAESHDTAEYNYVAFDELTHFTEYQYLYLISRCRSSVPGVPAIMRSASNPGNIGHSWVRARFVEPAKDGFTVIRDAVSKQNRIFIPAKATDNPYLLDNDPTYISKLDMLPEAQRKSKKDGDWWAFSGQFYPEFRSVHYPDEPANALHIIDPFEIPVWWPKVIAIDWGYKAMTWAGWGAVSPEGRLFLYREYSCKKKPISTWASEIAALSARDGNIAAVVIDPSANQNRGHSRTIKDEFVEHSGFTITGDAINDRIAGALLIHDLLRWKPNPPKKIPETGYSPEMAQRIMRMLGVDALRDYEQLFLPEVPETNLPKLQIFSTCTELIKAIPLCVHHEKRKEDIAEFDGDDPIDGFRYLAQAWKNYIESSKTAADSRKEYSEVMTKFQRTGDHAQLHYDLSRLEGKVAPMAPFRLLSKRNRNLRRTG